jgi:hypothetical protein
MSIDTGIWDSWIAKGVGRVKYTTDNIWGNGNLSALVFLSSAPHYSGKQKTRKSK